MSLYKNCRPLYDFIKQLTNDFEDKRMDNIGTAIAWVVLLTILWLFFQILSDYLATW